MGRWSDIMRHAVSGNARGIRARGAVTPLFPFPSHEFSSRAPDLSRALCVDPMLGPG